MGYSDAACVDQQCNQRPFGEHGDGCKLESGLVVSGRCTHDIDEQRATDATLPELQHARRTPLHGSYVHGITYMAISVPDCGSTGGQSRAQSSQAAAKTKRAR